MVRALASHQCGSGSIPGHGVICGSSLLLVLVLAPRGFSSGIPDFPSPQKPTLLNSNSVSAALNTLTLKSSDVFIKDLQFYFFHFNRGTTFPTQIN